MSFDRNKKYYTYAMILYKDSMSYDYDKIINYITSNWSMYGYIEHEPEKDETKKHTHVLVHFNNKRYINAIAKELNLPSNYIEPVNFIPYLRYLIHFDDEDKIQYTTNDVVGPLQSKLVLILSKGTLSEEEQVSLICDYIFESPVKVSLTDLLQNVLANGCYSAFRRNYTFFKDLVLENNRNK